MITQLHIKNFRSSPEWEFSFGEKTYIMGENGSGKTHILDVIHYLGGSPFMYTDPTMESGTLLELQFREHAFARTFGFYTDQHRGVFAIQGAKVSKPKYLQTIPFRTVYVSPFDMNLLYFSPTQRREYIDNILGRSFEQFSATQKSYEQVMRQRNALLKKIQDHQASRNDLIFWDQKFAELTEIYLLYRKKYTDYVLDHLDIVHEEIPKYTITYSYTSTVEEKRTSSDESVYSIIMRYLEENRERDILTGHTHIGPHRDDFTFLVETAHGPRIASQFLSRGEMKMLLLSLKKIEVHFLGSHIDLPIILLVDDIFAELDEKNIVQFLHSLTTYQTILTSQKPLPEGEHWNDFTCINLKDT